MRNRRQGGFRLGSPCARLLLLVVGFQGITPDLNDLASSRVLELLVSWGPTTCPWGSDGGSHGEVSGPVAGDLDGLARGLDEAAFGRVDDGPATIMSEVASAGRTRRGAEPLIHLLCHLTC